MTNLKSDQDHEHPEPPERRLWLAVVERSVRDYLSSNKGYCFRRDRKKARMWLFSDSTEFGSFRWVALHFTKDEAAFVRKLCEMLTLPRSAARRALGDWYMRGRD